MKKILLVAVIAAAELALCAPAFATPTAKRFSCVGVIKAVDPAASSVTARVRLASYGVADYLKKDLTIAVAENA